MKIIGVVVLYNPNQSIIENIKSYVNNLNKLFIVDNSETKNNDLVEKIKSLSSKCNYIDNHGNQGIAQALNIGVNNAIEDGANWLLTMDQDTGFNHGDTQTVYEQLTIVDINQIAIVAPSHFSNNEDKPFYNEIVMTSGNFLNLHLVQKVGKFNENLFIDSVDTEYCLRIYNKGYKIKRIPSVVLNHNLGDIKRYKVLGINFTPTNHNYLRRYYIIRNRFYIWDKYNKVHPNFVRWEKKTTLKEFIKIILFEKSKLLKIKFSIFGYLDFKRKKFGKYQK